MKAVDNDPGNISYKASLLRAKIKASQEHFEKGKEFEKAGVVEVEFQDGRVVLGARGPKRGKGDAGPEQGRLF